MKYFALISVILSSLLIKTVNESAVFSSKLDKPITIEEKCGEPLPYANTIDKHVNDLVWSEGYELTWADFTGAPSLPAYHIATSATYLHEEHGCNEFGEFTHLVKAIFSPSQSWSLDKHSISLLKHEQLHFDLTEYYARLMRQMFISLDKPCNISQDKLALMVEQLYEDLETAHDLYDHHTVHGTDKAQQKKWSVIIKRSLLELEEYSEHSLTSFK